MTNLFIFSKNPNISLTAEEEIFLENFSSVEENKNSCPREIVVLHQGEVVSKKFKKIPFSDNLAFEFQRWKRYLEKLRKRVNIRVLILINDLSLINNQLRPLIDDEGPKIFLPFLMSNIDEAIKILDFRYTYIRSNDFFLFKRRLSEYLLEKEKKNTLGLRKFYSVANFVENDLETFYFIKLMRDIDNYDVIIDNNIDNIKYVKEFYPNFSEKFYLI